MAYPEKRFCFRSRRHHILLILLPLLALLYLPGSSSTPTTLPPTFGRHSRQSPAFDSPDSRQTYIVHVRKLKGLVFSSQEELQNWHKSFLPGSPANAVGRSPRILYSYEHVISGFAARLTSEELKAMEAKEGFVRAAPARLGRLQSTYVPQFLGLPGEAGPWRTSNYGRGIIIGVVDTGILPSHPSFDDHGMPPPPKKWKGRCDFNTTRTARGRCNKKLIGARVYVDGWKADFPDEPITPGDTDGHGTHAASVAAGAFVKNAGVLGQARGTAAGVAPYAHIASYKACLGSFCADTDALAAIDQAIKDGVDVISLLILFSTSQPFYEDNIAMATFRAAEKGVFVACAAGNEGPKPGSVGNALPWVLTVGASTIDRTTRASVRLGNGSVELQGEAMYQPANFPKRPLPLVYPGANGDENAEVCRSGSLDELDVKGKVVVCSRAVGTRAGSAAVVRQAGGAAMVLMNAESDGDTVQADAYDVPTVEVSYTDALRLRAYLNSSSSAGQKGTAARLYRGTLFGSPMSPTVASFSGRGPSSSGAGASGILKPDVVGPGVNILGAYPFKVGPSGTSWSTPATKGFNLMMGTSTAAAHLAGVAALLKASHPEWSPAAIRSAITTTSDALNKEGRPIGSGESTAQAASFFAMGAGHVNPGRAEDPGLIYDIHPDEYIGYLCGGLGYTDQQVAAVARRPVRCAAVKKLVAVGDLNYPSISVTVTTGGGWKSVERTLTNVGEAGAAYYAKVEQPEGVTVTVSPGQLRFRGTGDKANFRVYFRQSAAAAGNYSSGRVSEGSLRWVSATDQEKKRVVRSPISVTFK